MPPRDLGGVTAGVIDSEHFRQMHKVDPKHVIAEYRKSPGPDAYDLPGSMKV